MESNAFGLRLKELRTAAGLTQPELAEKTGMSKSGLADLEQGRYKPSWETVLSLAAALGLSCEAFQEPAADAAPAGRGRPIKPADETEPSAKPAAGEAKGKRKKGKGKSR